MKATEAAGLLTICAAYDNRKPDADQAKAWAMVLDGMRFEDCREAIVRHYQRSREWIMPADVISGVKRIRGDRVLEFGPLPDPPAHIDPDNVELHSRWLSETIRSIGDGTYQREPEQQPQAIQRDVIGELGMAGQEMPLSDVMANLRKQQQENRRRMADAKAERERQHEERRREQQAAREAARAELRDHTTTRSRPDGAASSVSRRTR